MKEPDKIILGGETIYPTVTTGRTSTPSSTTTPSSNPTSTIVYYQEIRKLLFSNRLVVCGSLSITGTAHQIHQIYQIMVHIYVKIEELEIIIIWVQVWLTIFLLFFNSRDREWSKCCIL